MKEIGGYFELELPIMKNELHENALKVNNARNALRLVLKQDSIQKVYLPYYTCDVIVDPIIKENVEIEYYFIDENFKPIFDFKKIELEELFVIVNYFGICKKNIEEVLEKQREKSFKLLIDNAQSFFSHLYCEENVYSINSARKFFGVPDGAYLTGIQIDKLKINEAYDNCHHLLIRLDKDAKSGFQMSKLNAKIQSNSEPLGMSKLSERILQTIDYNAVSQRRLRNFTVLSSELDKINKINMQKDSLDIPMVYPLLVEEGSKLREFLIQHNIYVAKYWPNTIIPIIKDSIEEYLIENIVALPTDQRYDEDDMNYIIQCIKAYYEEDKKI